MTPPIQATLAKAQRHWYGDAQGQDAHTFRGATLAQLRTVRHTEAVRQAEAAVETVALTGDVTATEEACHDLTRAYELALRQACEETLL